MPPKKSAVVKAAEAEATEPDAPVEVEFDGESYTILPGQPGALALTHLAEAADTDDGTKMILYVQEVVGRVEWRRWCGNHGADQIGDFVVEVGKTLSGQVGK